MLVCPKCKERLVPQRTPKGSMHVCRKCGGRAVSFSVLRRDPVSGEFMKRLWHGGGVHHTDGRNCPQCAEKMAVVQFALPDKPLFVDVCSSCQWAWFDATEYAKVATLRPPAAKPRPSGRFTPLPATTVPAPLKPTGPSPYPPPAAPRPPPPRGGPAARRPEKPPAVAKAAEYRPGADDGGTISLTPPSVWQWLPGILGLPVEVSGPRLTSTPFVTWSLSAVMVVLFFGLAMGENLEEAILNWGFIPDQWQRHGGMTLAASFFLHAGLFHLISNVYFLVVFGDNVEWHLGKGLFLLLLAGGHLAGLTLHALYSFDGSMPVVGASAGIAAVIAYYAIVFPQAKIAFWRFFVWIRLSVTTALALFVAVQILGAWMQMHGHSQVSYLGHLGGLAVGGVAGIVGRLVKPSEGI